ncbi:hypothetical protein [Dyadobacter sp. CY343]|uniref:hypothetical protein n=1 Tax=Dyadobacter sp. CY343 TaxID=2907299 RepID=UPI001F43A74F|nr:hypothetical protein [Dyadobacter sp. CY343]MCE7063257.1 hypothetical protein [Dyadobacter sp. CY343]
MHHDENRINRRLEELRLSTLEAGSAFMIRDTEFFEDGFINEYPDGSMKLMKLSEDQRSAFEIRTLTILEVAQMRKKHGLAGIIYA